MTMNMNEKGRTRLLAAIAIIAMVVCVFAVMSSENLSAAEGDDSTASQLPEPVDGVITLTQEFYNSHQMGYGNFKAFRLINYEVPDGVNTIDLGGFTVKGPAAGGGYAIIVPEGSEITLTNGTIQSNYGGVKCLGSVTLESTLTLKSSEGIALDIIGGSAVIDGATVKMTSAQKYPTVRVQVSDDVPGKLVMNSGSIGMTFNDAVESALSIEGGDVTINGGTVTSTSSTAVFVGNSDLDNTADSIHGKLTVNDGSIIGVGGYALGGDNTMSAGAVIDINGGELSTESTDSCAVFISMESRVTIDYATITGGMTVKMGDITINNTKITESRERPSEYNVNGTGGQTNGSALIINTQLYGGSEGQYIGSPALNVTIGSGCDITSTSTSTYDVDVYNCKATGDGVESSVTINSAVGSMSVSNGTGSDSTTVAVEVNDVDDLTLTGDADVIIDGDVGFNATAENKVTRSLLVNEGASVTGKFTNIALTRILGDASEAEITNNDMLTVGTNGSVPENMTGDGQVMSDSAVSDDNTGFQGQLNFNLEISTPEYLSGDYIIAEGYTFTIRAGGSLALNGYQLIVNGNLVIENGGSITGIGDVRDKPEGVMLTPSGVIDNSGLIGKGATAVSVEAYAESTGTTTVTAHGAVTMLNVMGISLSLDKTVSSGAIDYQLAISGNAVRNGTGSYILATEGAIITGDLTIGNSVTFSAGTCTDNGNAHNTVVDGVTVTINGIVDGTLELLNGSTVVMNGQTSMSKTFAVTAVTGEYVTNEKVDSIATSTTSITFTNVRGVTVEVVSESYMDDKVSMTEQKMLVSGTAARATQIVAEGKTASTDAKDYTLATSGTGFYVEGEFYLPLGGTGAITFDLKSKMTVTGQVSANGQIDTTDRATYITGTAYSVGTTDMVYYVTGFDAAYAAIDTANSKTITVYGDLELTGEYTIAQGQIVELKTAPAYDATNGLTAGVLIAENGAFTIENGGYVNGQFGEIQGVLTVIYGGTTQTEPLMYAVKTTNANNDVIYSGLAYALNNATEGQTVNLVKNTTVDGSLTIPAGVTLDVNSGATLTVNRNLTVEGTLDNHGTVSVGRNVSVSGTIDNTEVAASNFNACTANTDDEYDVTVSGTGSIVFASGATFENQYNGAYFNNDDGNVVFTTLSNAATSVAGYDIVNPITVIGDYSENATVNANGPVTIEGTVSVTEIVLDDCPLTITGTFTGAVTGQSGEDGSTVASTVQFNRATDVVVTNGSAPNEANVTVWTTTVSLYDDNNDETPAIENFGQNGGTPATYETMTVTAGVITLGAMTIDAGANDAPSVTVNAGATIVIPDTIDDNDFVSNGLVVDGTITVEGSMTANKGTVINGTMDIALEGKVVSNGMVVTGTVNVATQEDQTPGDLVVTGVLTLGERPETLGAAATGAVVGPVKFGTNATASDRYIVAYAGADMSGAVFEQNQGVSTGFYINDALYMTVYAQGNSDVGIDMTDITEIGEIDLVGYVVPTTTVENETVNDITWYDADGKEITSGNVGSIDAVYTTFKVSNIPGVISVGNGLSMYIDGLTIANFVAPEGSEYKFQLPVGTHTVSIAAEYGYDATNAVITFNGQTVQNGGTITVTADMVQDGFTLAASGAVPSTSGGSTTVVGGDDGMGLTDYLLIILVILIVVMAIMVAMRLMRS